MAKKCGNNSDVGVHPLIVWFKVLINEDTLSRTHCCSWCFLGCANWETFVADTKCFWTKLETILCPGHKICVRNKCCACGQTGKHLGRQQCVLVCQYLDKQKLNGLRTISQVSKVKCKFVLGVITGTPFSIAEELVSGQVLWHHTKVFFFRVGWGYGENDHKNVAHSQAPTILMRFYIKSNRFCLDEKKQNVFDHISAFLLFSLLHTRLHWKTHNFWTSPNDRKRCREWQHMAFPSKTKNNFSGTSISQPTHSMSLSVPGSFSLSSAALSCLVFTVFFYHEWKVFTAIRLERVTLKSTSREFETTTAMGTSLNKRFNDQNNGCARAL